MFEETFKTELTFVLGDKLQIDKLWNEVCSHYSEPSRHYHNLSHLDNLLEHLEAVKDKIQHWQIVIFALAYHDIIYNIFKQNNELESARLAEKRLLEIKLPNALIEKCKQMIFATKDHQVNTDDDINYFTDADLSVLGSSPGSYQLFVNNIRKEYDRYPDLIYKPGRLKILQHFLKMERIYKTKYFFKKLESQARKNIHMEMQQLL